MGRGNSMLIPKENDDIQLIDVFNINYKTGQEIPMDQNGWFIITNNKEKIYYHNKSSIMKNLLIRKNHVFNGWSILGKYIGEVIDYRYYPQQDRHYWQAKRVYQDELDILNQGIYRLQNKIREE